MGNKKWVVTITLNEKDYERLCAKAKAMGVPPDEAARRIMSDALFEFGRVSACE